LKKRILTRLLIYDLKCIWRLYEWWFFSDKKFDERLHEFNERKIMLKNEGLERFIIKKYDTVYERFYKNLPDGTANADGFYSLVAPHPWFGDYAMWIDMFEGFWLPDF